MARSVRTIATAAVVLALLGSGLSRAALPGVGRVLGGTVSPLVSQAQKLGALAPRQRIGISLPLVLPGQSALNRFVAAQYDPASQDYLRFLTPARFGARFGAPVSEVDQVESALARLGLTVVTPSVNHLYVSATGTTAQLEQIFDTTLDRFHVALTGAAARFGNGDFFANVRDIRLPASLNGLVTGVLGLDDADRPLPGIAAPSPSAIAQRKPQLGTPTGQDGGATPCAGAAAGGGYTAPDLATAYGFDPLYAKGLLGQGMSAALVEFDDYHDSNVAGLESCYGITTPVTRRPVDGGSGGPPGSGEGEDMLDMSTLMPLVPDLAHLYVYVAPSTGVGPQAVAYGSQEIDLYDAFVTDDDASVLSSSWGSCEELASQAYSDLFNTITEEAAAQGQQIFEDTQDTGAEACRGYPDPTSGSLSIEEEAASPWVTAVGGTDLSEESTVLGAAIHHEDTWNDGGSGGGGQSVVSPMPAYQQNYLTAAGDTPPGAVGGSSTTPSPCGTTVGYCRMVPDLALNADPDLGGIANVPDGPTPPQFAGSGDVGSPGDDTYCDTENCSLVSLLGSPIPAPNVDTAGGWYPEGGTSAATPNLAAAAVLWDQEAKAAGLSGLGFLNPSLYRIASSASANATDFHDITVGSNSDQYSASGCPSGCNPKELYDSGPGYDMASGLGSPNAANLGANLVADAGAVDVTPGSESMYGYTHGGTTTAAVSLTSGYSRATFTATSSAAWLHVTASGTIPSTLKWHVDPTGLAAGTYTGTITVTGADGRQGTLRVTYQVTKPATIGVSPGALSFSESAVSSSGAATTPACGSTVWDDQLEYGGKVGGYSATDVPHPPASTLQTLTITNTGPAGSVLHLEAYEITSTSAWLAPNLDPSGTGTDFQTAPEQPLIPSVAALASGHSVKIDLASVANANAASAFPHLDQGTYTGTVYIKDLADPATLTRVPVTLVLGNGKGTPTIATTPSAISVTEAPGAAQTVNLVLSDSSGVCGYAYSLASSASWASVGEDLYSGTVAATPATAAPSDPASSGSGNGFTPVTVTAPADAKPGIYHAEITINSQNANANPTTVPITLTVPGAVAPSPASTRAPRPKTCARNRTLRFRQHPAAPGREVSAVVSIDGRVVRRYRGHAIRVISLRRPTRSRFRLTIVATLSNHEVIRHSVTYSGCRTSRTVTTVLRRPRR